MTIQPTELTDIMLNYTVSQLGVEGSVLGEITVQATNYNSALRELPKLASGCHKIVVFNSDGEKAGEVGAGFWQQRIRRK